MVEITIQGKTAIFEVKGQDKLWALRSRLEIPLANITGVHPDPAPAMGWFQGLKLAGTDLPNFFRAGIFYQNGGIVFWDVRHPEKTIVVELADETFRKLVIEVADPDAAVSLIHRAR